MPDRQPKPWESESGRFIIRLQRARGTVEVWALGGERFIVRAPNVTLEVESFEAARDELSRLATQLEH